MAGLASYMHWSSSHRTHVWHQDFFFSLFLSSFILRIRMCGPFFFSACIFRAQRMCRVLSTVSTLLWDVSIPASSPAVREYMFSTFWKKLTWITRPIYPFIANERSAVRLASQQSGCSVSTTTRFLFFFVMPTLFPKIEQFICWTCQRIFQCSTGIILWDSIYCYVLCGRLLCGIFSIFSFILLTVVVLPAYVCYGEGWLVWRRACKPVSSVVHHCIERAQMYSKGFEMKAVNKALLLFCCCCCPSISLCHIEWSVIKAMENAASHHLFGQLERKMPE